MADEHMIAGPKQTTRLNRDLTVGEISCRQLRLLVWGGWGQLQGAEQPWRAFSKELQGRLGTATAAAYAVYGVRPL